MATGPQPFIHSSVKAFRGNIALVDAYVWELYPEIVSKAIGKSKAFSFSPEDNLIDVLGFKLATTLRLGGIKSVTVVVKAGSPHAIQIPFIVQEAVEDVRYPKEKVTYYAIEKGNLVLISDAAVRTARHLNEVQALLEHAPKKRAKKA